MRALYGNGPASRVRVAVNGRSPRRRAHQPRADARRPNTSRPGFLAHRSRAQTRLPPSSDSDPAVRRRHRLAGHAEPATRTTETGAPKRVRTLLALRISPAARAPQRSSRGAGSTVSFQNHIPILAVGLLLGLTHLAYAAPEREAIVRPCRLSHRGAGGLRLLFRPSTSHHRRCSRNARRARLDGFLNE
jgi:hypothetical protein